MTINKDKIRELKEKLIEEKVKFEEELKIIAKPNEEGDDFATKFEEVGEESDENASEVSMYESSLGVEDSLEKQLKEVNSALKKIESGKYGKCELCGRDIRVERLEVYPGAKNCMKCNQ